MTEDNDLDVDSRVNAVVPPEKFPADYDGIYPSKPPAESVAKNVVTASTSEPALSRVGEPCPVCKTDVCQLLVDGREPHQVSQR